MSLQYVEQDEGVTRASVNINHVNHVNQQEF